MYTLSYIFPRGRLFGTQTSNFIEEIGFFGPVYKASVQIRVRAYILGNLNFQSFFGLFIRPQIKFGLRISTSGRGFEPKISARFQLCYRNLRYVFIFFRIV